MANFYADIPAVVNGPAFGQPLATRLKTNKLNGRIRYMEAVYVAPPAGALPAIADKIVFGKLPLKARIIGHLSRVYWSTGTALCTLAIGDNINSARHLAATAISAAGSATPEASAISTTSLADVTINSAVLTNVRSIGAYGAGSLLAGTGIPTGTRVVAIDYSSRTVTMSAAATATTANVTVTVTGGSYEPQDDSNTVSNDFLSLVDDATIMGLVAGAQIANNQVITLKLAYVQD